MRSQIKGESESNGWERDQKDQWLTTMRRWYDPTIHHSMKSRTSTWGTHQEENLWICKGRHETNLRLANQRERILKADWQKDDGRASNHVARREGKTRSQHEKSDWAT